MTKNPFVNALAATAYITAISSALYYAPNIAVPKGGSVMIPIAFLSLFVLSAALMGYFFIYQPIVLVVEGKQKEAIGLFLKTVAAFACITGAIVLLWLVLSQIL